jgi:hypothetical protein
MPCQRKAAGTRPILPKLAAIADAGSVITRDHFVKILTALYANGAARDAFAYLIDQLTRCPTNQLPMYAENAAPVIRRDNKAKMVELLTSRLDEVEKESKRKRVEKVISRLMK